MDSDLVFKALADPTRRALLDRLQERDGQSLAELTSELGMTRYGVMKHLRVLEAAELVTAIRRGRQTLHYLNAVPIQEIYNRWIDKYRAPFTLALTSLKRQLEEPHMPELRHVYRMLIKTTPEALWDALTNPEMTQQYFHATRIQSEWTPGSPYEMLLPDGSVAAKGDVVEVDRGKKLVLTWSFQYAPDVAQDPPSRVTYEIEDRGGVCLLMVTHDGFASETQTFQAVGPGWAELLSSLKTLLETGVALPVAAG